MRAVALVALLCACEREWVRDYDGTVPGTHLEARATVLLVRDAFTGNPVQGAVVRKCPENEMGRDGRWAPLLAEGRTDEFGLVTFPLPAEPEAPVLCHWTVHADGYAPTETYGAWIAEEVELRPRREYVGRLLAIDGHPLAGAAVEWKVGCAHSPSLASATTDGDGMFRFQGIDDAGDFVVEDPRGAADYIDARESGFGVHMEQLWPGRTIRGRVVTQDGAPPPWAVVATSARGPRARADARGRFALRGFRAGALEVWWDGPWTQFKEELAPGLEARLAVGGPRIRPRHVNVRVRVRDASGAPPLVAIPIHLDALADGRRHSFEWSPWGDGVVASVPHGTYRVCAGDPSSAYVGDPTIVRTSGAKQLDLVVHPQPTVSFDLHGLPEDAPARCSIVLEDGSWPVPLGDPAYLPATARAWLRVDLGKTPYTFPIGPEHDGVRHATVRLPGRKVIRVPGLEEGLRAELIGEEAAIAGREEAGHIEIGSAGLATYAVGEQWLALEDAEKGHALVKLDLPFEAATIEPDCKLTPWPEPKELRVLLDDGMRVAGAYVTALDEDHDFPHEPDETDSTGTLRRRSFRDGLHLRIDRQACVPSWARLSGEPPYEVRLGSAVVELDVTGLESPACVLDGVPYAPEGGRIVLRGVAAGRHTLVVGAAGRKGVAYGLILRAGETRRIKP